MSVPDNKTKGSDVPMEQETDDICRLCLKSGDDTFKDFSDLPAKEKLRNILPNLNLDNPREYVACRKCRTALNECYQFLRTFTRCDHIIRTEKKRLGIVNKINLNRVVKYKNEIMRDLRRNICRFCLKCRAGKYVGLNKADFDKTFNDMLKTCFPKLDPNLSSNPLMCPSCQKKIHEMYDFKKDCLSVEKKLVQYSKTSSEKQVDLKKVLDFFKKQKPKEQSSSDEVKHVTKDGVLTPVSKQSHSEKTDLNKKRTAPEEESDIVPSKKQKPSEPKENNNTAANQAAVNHPIQRVILPHFTFRFSLLHSTMRIGELEEWLSLVDKLKKTNGWTDLRTMNQVLQKLEVIRELHIWFSKMASILKWEEWKEKLIQAFPSENDYGLLLKRMVNRKKKPGETFVEYYDAKMEILNAMNITGENAVFCLLGGIFDAVIRCVGRGGNYRTPEELLLFFKTCDSKTTLRIRRCRVCSERTHASSACPLVRRSISATKKVGRRDNTVKRITNSEHSIHRKSINIARRPRSDKASGKSVGGNASFQKQTKESSATAKSDKPQESVVATKSNKDTPSAVTTEKQSKQSDDDACFVKPQPPGPKSTSSSISQGKGSSPSKPQVQKAVGGGSTSTVKQSEGGSSKRGSHSAEQKPQSKENKVEGKTQTQNNQRKDTSSTRPTQRNEKSDKGASTTPPKEQKKENNNSNVRSSRPPNRKERRAALQPQAQNNTILNFVNFVRPTASVEGRSGQQKEAAHRSSSAATPHEQRSGNHSSRGTSATSSHGWRRENYPSRDRSQRRKEKGYVYNAATLQDWRDGDYFSRATSRSEEYMEESYSDRDRRLYEERDAGGYSSRDLPSDVYQDHMEQGASNVRPGDERDVGYSSRDMSVRSHDERDVGYSGRDQDRLERSLFDERDVGYSDRHLTDGRYQDRFERGIFDERDDVYSDRDLLDGRYQDHMERSTSSVRPQDERDVGHGSRDISVQSRDVGYSSDRYQDRMERGASGVRPHDKRDNGYDNRDVPVRLEDQSIEGYLRRDLLSDRYEDHMERGLSSVRPRDEREVGYSNRLEEQGTESYPRRMLSGEIYEGHVGIDFSPPDTFARFEEEALERFPRRDLVSDIFDDPVERGASGVRSHEGRDTDYSVRETFARFEQEALEKYPRRDLVSDIFGDRVERGASGVRAHEERDVSLSSRDTFARPEEQTLESYPRRDFSSIIFDDPVERDPSSVRPHEERVSLSSRDTFTRPEERTLESYPRRDFSSIIFDDPVERDPSSVRPHEERDVSLSSRDTFTRPEESYPRRDFSSIIFDDPVERDASSVRQPEEREISYVERFRREIEGDNINMNISSGIRRIGEVYNRDILNSRPARDEGGNANRNLSGARAEADWESSYVAKGATAARRADRVDEDVSNKGAPSDRPPEDKKMEGRGFRTEVLTERNYLNRDAPSAKPGDARYPDRAASTANPKETRDGSYLNKSTLPSEKIPGQGEENYFNKNMSSSRMLGSNLAGLFSLSLASRPFTSYPSCVTAAKPLGLGSYFNRGLSHNRLREYDEANRGMLGARGQQPTMDNSLLRGPGPSTAKHQEQSHRELCLKCYTIGHKSTDCPKFRPK